jgi:aspartate-semialdehyde dehydrogenase
MSTNANSEFNKQDTETDDVVQGGDTIDNSYATGRNEPVPVVKDEVPVEQPNDKRNPDSDAALGECTIMPDFMALPASHPSTSYPLSSNTNLDERKCC